MKFYIDPHTQWARRDQREVIYPGWLVATFISKGIYMRLWFCVHLLICSVVFNCFKYPRTVAHQALCPLNFLASTIEHHFLPRGSSWPIGIEPAPTVSPELQVEFYSIELSFQVTSRQRDHHICVYYSFKSLCRGLNGVVVYTVMVLLTDDSLRAGIFEVAPREGECIF